VFHILFQVMNRGADLDFVLPVIVCPFLLEFKFRTLSRHECIDEIYLNLVDVDHIGNVTTGRVKCKVSIDCSIVS